MTATAAPVLQSATAGWWTGHLPDYELRRSVGAGAVAGRTRVLHATHGSCRARGDLPNTELFLRAAESWIEWAFESDLQRAARGEALTFSYCLKCLIRRRPS